MSKNREASVTIRLKPEEYFIISKAAELEVLSISSYLRRIILKDLRTNYPQLFKK